LDKHINPILVLAIVAMTFVAFLPTTAALAPAKAPGWKINDNWTYEGKLVIIVTFNLNVSLNVTGKGDISVGPNTYSVYTLDFSIRASLGALVSTISGKDYYEQHDYSLIKTESTATENNKVKTTTVTYDPPKREVNFPLEVGKEWEDDHTITTVVSVDNVPTTTVTNEQFTYLVAGTDAVDTKVGQLECYRITATNKTGHAVTYWYSAQVGQFVRLAFPALPNSDVTLVDYQYAPSGGGGHDGGPNNSLLILAIILIIIVIIVVVVIIAVVIARKRSVVATQQPSVQTVAGPSPVTQPVALPQSMIEDVFLVYRDGRLIHHDARRLKPEVDQDVLGGMLTAIQDFVNRSFPSSDGTPGAVREIRYADNRILLEKGQFVYLAVVTDMVDAAALQARMASLVRLIEVRCRGGLAEWDGNLESVAEAKRLSRMILSDEPIPLQ
jgi:hypothetical protein